ncbi:MAG: hypothetical protein V1708_04655 [Candidatus Micrarchaeota archaeon]
MKNVDHRRGRSEVVYTRKLVGRRWESKIPGARIRQMNVSRTFPGVQLVIKDSTHFGERMSADEINGEVRAFVSIHNKANAGRQQGYSFRAPIAYPISKRLIAMAKTKSPTLEEIVSEKHGTARGRRFFEALERKSGVKRADLMNAYESLVDDSSNMPFGRGRIPDLTRTDSLLLIGYRNKKFVFMPLVDLK